VRGLRPARIEIGLFDEKLLAARTRSFQVAVCFSNFVSSYIAGVCRLIRSIVVMLHSMQALKRCALACRIVDDVQSLV